MKPMPCLLLLALAMPSWASNAEWLRCAELADSAARLACYDAQAARLRTRPAEPPQAPPDSARFGAPQKAEPESIDSHIAGTLDGWGPRTVFTLANGQRWAVNDGSSASLWLKDAKVTLRRAALGGYRIEFAGSNQTARVRRVE